LRKVDLGNELIFFALMEGLPLAKGFLMGDLFLQKNILTGTDVVPEFVLRSVIVWFIMLVKSAWNDGRSKDLCRRNNVL